MRYFIWGIFLFAFNLCALFLGYYKDFAFTSSFIINLNQITAFVIGIMYSQKYRRFEALSILANTFVFTAMTSLLFAVYDNRVNFIFFIGAFSFIFISMISGHFIYYKLFYSKPKYSKKKKYKIAAKM